MAKLNTNKEKSTIFKECTAIEYPYYHFRVESFFKTSVAKELLKWLAHTELFKTANGDFYTQTIFPITTRNLPEELRYVFNKDNCKLILTYAEKYFKTNLHDNFMITSHRLLQGQETLIHNDYIKDPYSIKYGFTHRIIVYLNNQWKKEDGGVLGLYSSSDYSDLELTYEPIHNTAVGIAFSPNSYHDVKEVIHGERYTINFSFLSKNIKYKV